MHNSVISLHVGIRAFVNIIVLRPELCHAGLNQFPSNAGRMVNTRFPTPFRFGLKILTCCIKICPIPMSRHRHIGQMLIHHAGGKHEGPLDSRSLSFMDGCSIAIINISIAILAYNNVAAVIETDGKQRIIMSAAGGNDSTKQTILDILWAKPGCPLFNKPGIFEEDDPVTNSKFPHTTFSSEFPRHRQRTFLLHFFTKSCVEAPYILVGMGKHEQFVTI